VAGIVNANEYCHCPTSDLYCEAILLYQTDENCRPHVKKTRKAEELSSATLPGKLSQVMLNCSPTALFIFLFWFARAAQDAVCQSRLWTRSPTDFHHRTQ
jgi:hypothetical protein